MPKAVLSYADEAFAFVENLDRLTNPAAVMASMVQSLSRFGFDSFIITVLPGPRETVEQSVLLKKWPLGWFDVYVSSDYVRHDPVVRRCRTSVQPFAWSDVHVDPQTDPTSAEVMNRAADFGMKQGFCLPIHGMRGYEACISMSGSDIDLSSQSKPALHLMSMYAFERIRSCSNPLPTRTLKHLTGREREALIWAAAGKSAADTGDILGITERTVTAHIVSACQKLEAADKTQAVARAMQYRLISL